jgi:hypothetical protein
MWLFDARGVVLLGREREPERSEGGVDAAPRIQQMGNRPVATNSNNDRAAFSARDPQNIAPNPGCGGRGKRTGDGEHPPAIRVVYSGNGASGS